MAENFLRTQAARSVLSRGVPAVSINLGAATAAVAAPMLDVRSAGAAGQGMAAIGQGIGAGADVLGRLASQQAKQINERHILEAESAMDDVRGKIAARWINEPDETKWQGIASEEMTTAESGILHESLSPDAREAVSARMVRWRGRTLGEAMVNSARRSREKLTEQLGARAMRFEEAGDAAGASAVYNHMESAGLLAADRAEALRQKATQTADLKTREVSQNRFAQALDADPAAALKALESVDADGASVEFPGMDANDVLRLKASAEKAVRKQQAEGVEAIRNGIVLGEADEKLIEAHGKSLGLGAEDVAVLKQFRSKLAAEKASNEPFDWKEAARLQADISRFDPDAYKSPEEAQRAYEEMSMRAELLSARGGDVGQKTGGVWSQRLYQKHPYHERRPTGDDKDALKLMDDLLEAYEKDGSFGAPTIQVRKDKKTMKDGAETTVAAFEDEPNPDFVKLRIRASQYLKPQLEKAIQSGTLNPNDFDAMDAWVRKRLTFLKAGEAVKAGRAATTGPATDLLPPPGWDAESNLGNILAPAPQQ